MKISRLTAVQALHAGIDAAQAGAPVTACPYDPNGILSQQFAAIWWVKGWRRGTTESLQAAAAVEVPAT